MSEVMIESCLIDEVAGGEVAAGIRRRTEIQDRAEQKLQGQARLAQFSIANRLGVSVFQFR